MASEHFHDHGDVWHNSNPNVSWAETLEHAEKIGVGTRQYELITMKQYDIKKKYKKGGLYEYKISIKCVSTFDDALDYLKNAK